MLLIFKTTGTGELNVFSTFFSLHTFPCVTQILHKTMGGDGAYSHIQSVISGKFKGHSCLVHVLYAVYVGLSETVPGF